MIKDECRCTGISHLKGSFPFALSLKHLHTTLSYCSSFPWSSPLFFDFLSYQFVPNVSFCLCISSLSLIPSRDHTTTHSLLPSIPKSKTLPMDDLFSCILDFLVLLLNLTRIYITSLFKYVLPYSLLPKKSLNGKKVLITGAGSGMGRLLAQKIAANGAVLILWDVNGKAVDELRDQIKHNGGEVSPGRSTVGVRRCVPGSCIPGGLVWPQKDCRGGWKSSRRYWKGWHSGKQCRSGHRWKSSSDGLLE